MPERVRSRSFGPTVVLGLSAGALTAVAATRDWATASGSAAGVDVSAAAKGSSSAPLGIALGLVALASWGVVLVLRGRVRRVVALVGALASAGVLAATLAALGGVQDDAVEALVGRGATGDTSTASLTGWYFACAVSAVLTLGSFAVAVALAPGWPAMGSRYDAPATRTAAASAAAGAAAGAGTGAGGGPVTEQDMWRALDDGRDPTA